MLQPRLCKPFVGICFFSAEASGPFDGAPFLLDSYSCHDMPRSSQLVCRMPLWLSFLDQPWSLTPRFAHSSPRLDSQPEKQDNAEGLRSDLYFFQSAHRRQSRDQNARTKILASDSALYRLSNRTALNLLVTSLHQHHQKDYCTNQLNPPH